MPRGRLRLPDDLAGVLRSEWEHLITEASLGVEDTRIAWLYIVEKLPQIEVAMELNMDRATVSRRMPNIIMRVRMAKEKTSARG